MYKKIGPKETAIRFEDITATSRSYETNTYKTHHGLGWQPELALVLTPSLGDGLSALIFKRATKSASDSKRARLRILVTLLDWFRNCLLTNLRLSRKRDCSSFNRRMHPKISSALNAAASAPLAEADPLAAAAEAELPATGASGPPTAALGDELASSSMVADRLLSRLEPSLQWC